MTPQRAQQIWDNRLPFGELSVSDAERLAVRKVWDGMPGHTCFADALLRIARGEAIAEKPAMIGTAVFTYGGEIVEQTPVYEGETPGSEAVYMRARRSIEVLGMPATDPVYGCNARGIKLANATLKFYPSGH
jgi:hypothetical protein